MNDTETHTIQVPRACWDRLHDLARRTKRSEASLASEALEAYIAIQESHVAAISEALEASKAGTPPIEHAEVEAWLLSWGAEHELPPPR